MKTTQHGIRISPKTLGIAAVVLVLVGFAAWRAGPDAARRWLGAAGGAGQAVEDVVAPPAAAADQDEQGGTQLWTCGMHPDVIRDEPGSCPICGMDLVPIRAEVEETAAEAPAAGTSGSRTDADPAEDRPAAGKQLWTCGMHPEIIRDEPGTCPICGMDLVPIRADVEDAGGGGATDTAAAGGHGKILFYRSPMDPNVTSPVPRKDEMGMDFVPVYADEAGGAGAQGATVKIDPVMIQNMNVTTEPVHRRSVRRQIRTVGYLDYDQEKLVSVTTKYQGFVENVRANYVGQSVRKGDPLFEIYAPALVQTQQELLSARDYARKMADAPADVAARAEALYRAVRERLGFWDISPAQIDRIEQTGKVMRTLEVDAPATGLVRTRMVGLEGMATKPGMELLTIADLSSLWLVAEVYENQLPWVDVDSTATVTLDYFPGESFTGTVRYVEPHLADRTRSVQVTLEIPNPGGRLRAGMYATVRFEPVVAADAITVPAQSVLRTGERDVVVVALGGGRFAPRDVVLGPEGDGFVQVLSGLADGDVVVTSSQFLIDSESNLRAAILKMIAEKQH